MDSETIWRIIMAATGPVTIAVWVWLTKTYIPARQKRTDDQAAHERQREDSNQELGEGISKQLLAHIITLTDGQFSQLRDQVNSKLDGIAASQNQIIVFMSRNQAALPVIGHVADWTDADEIASAAISSAADQKVAAIVAAAVTPDEAKDG